MSDEKIIISNDQAKNIDQTDKDFLNSAASGEGLIEISSADQLMELAQMAQTAFKKFRAQVDAIMNQERAQIIRDLRVEQDYSWRAVARECHIQFAGTWEPVSNQLAGMALCEAAAELFGENYMEEPWN